MITTGVVKKKKKTFFWKKGNGLGGIKWGLFFGGCVGRAGWAGF